MSFKAEIRRLTTPQDLFHAAADEVVERARAAIQARGRFSIALSGGSTPRALYTLLATNARTAVPWDQVFFFWSDERHVPPDNPESNYRMAEEALLSKIPLDPANVFRVSAENPDAEAAALAYEQTLRKFFSVKPPDVPKFDLILLGMGPDGHTASLFPESAALAQNSRLVVANWVEKLKTHRITFTVPVLNAARCVVFLVSGSEKAGVLREVLEGKASGERFPSKLVQPTDGKLIWFVDAGAASELSRSS